LEEKLYLLNEVYTSGYVWNILDMISIFAVFCAISVIINKNPIISVLFLIGLFASISCYLIIRFKFYSFILFNSIYSCSFNSVFIYINVN